MQSNTFAQDISALPIGEAQIVLSLLHGSEGVAAYRLLGLTLTAESLAGDASKGMPEQSGVLAQIEALLYRVTAVSMELVNAVNDFDGPISGDMADLVTSLAHRVSESAETIRDAAPFEASLYAAYHAAFTMLHLAAQPIYRVAA